LTAKDIIFLRAASPRAKEISEALGDSGKPAGPRLRLAEA